MSKQTHFFATKSDLEPGLKNFEKSLDLKYYSTGYCRTSKIPTFSSLLEYKTLGKNTSGDHISGEAFLIQKAERKLRFEKISTVTDGLFYSATQKVNPVSIRLLPGGIYKKRNLVCGHAGTISADAESIGIYKKFKKIVLAGFKCINPYWLGPEAYSLGKKGFRFVTISVDSPKTCDLKL